MTLLLNGEKVQGKGLKVMATLTIESEDLSGQTSNTAQAHKGFKPKTLSVTLMIPYRDESDLRNLMRLASSTAGGGQLTVYRIVNRTASAFGVREVQFRDNVNANEDDSLRAWRVQFNLIEKLSIPERVEQRSPSNPVVQQSAPGQPVSGTSGADGGNAPVEMDGFEKVLKSVDDWLKPVTP